MINPSLMNPIERSMYDSVINRTLRNTATPTTGTIISLSEDTWTAVVEMVDPFNGDLIETRDVVIPGGVDGTKTIDPQVGDQVAINFASGDIYSPYIISIFNSSTEKPSSDYSGQLPDILSLF